MKKQSYHIWLKCLALLQSLLFSLFISAQTTDIPEKPNPPRLVNDLVGMLSSEENARLEHKLVAFDDSSSTQIAILIVPTLNGYEINDYSVRVFEKWKIGDAKKNNGVLIVVKPKTAEEKGRIWISTGYGMEGIVTDAITKRIIDQEIIPDFKKGDIYGGLDKATSVIMSLARGEYKPDQYLAKTKKSKEKSGWPALIVIGVLVFIFFVAGRGSGNSRHFSSGTDIPFWMLMGGLLGGGGRSSGGGFGDFSSGGGSFGGFGGGGTGGGGAGGSW